jgi:hypothetical protein
MKSTPLNVAVIVVGIMQKLAVKKYITAINAEWK